MEVGLGNLFGLRMECDPRQDRSILNPDFDTTVVIAGLSQGVADLKALQPASERKLVGLSER